MNRAGPLVVEVERSGLIESTHLVDVAVGRPDGELVASAGDAQTVAYLRSSAKPIQALACLENGWRPPGSEQIAVASASHNGEPAHIEAVRATLAAAGVSEQALRCPAAWPLLPEAAAAVDRPAPILHNCSGKHAGMLATSVANGWPLDDYEDPAHPMQRAVAMVVERLAGLDPRHVGVDGCGVPTFAYSLLESAVIFARLDDDGGVVLDAMAGHPFLVAGTGRVCTAVMQELPGVAIKIGAEGVACGVLRNRRVGFALKSRDGTNRGRDPAVVAVLEMLGERLPSGLAPHAAPAVIGGGGAVGTVRWRGGLQQA